MVTLSLNLFLLATNPALPASPDGNREAARDVARQQTEESSPCEDVEVGVLDKVLIDKRRAAMAAQCREACDIAISLLTGELGVRDASTAHLILKRHSGAGCAYAKRLFGRILVEGAGTPRDTETGVRLLQEAAEAGDGAAEYALARLYSAGRFGVVRDEQKANEHTRRASEAGFLLARVDYALLKTDNGKNVEALKNAITELTALAEGGFARAQSTLATIYTYGMGISPDRKLASKWAEPAASQGEPLAFVIHGLDWADKHPPGSSGFRRGMMFIELARREGDRTALRVFPDLVRQFGKDVLDQASRDADSFQPKPNESSHEALIAISDMPNGTLSADELAFLTTMEEQAKTGKPAAAIVLAEAYFRGEGRPRDRARAAELLLSAAQAGNSRAQRSIGLMYRWGCGVTVSPLEAAVWLKLSTNGTSSPDPSIAEILTRLMAELSSVEKDTVRARVANFRPMSRD
jgi:TPR repeat protein